MLTVGDKNYRNLQEQVLKNQYDIEHLKELGINADLGIKVVNAETPLASANDLPENYTGDYGDAYIVGTAAPFRLYVWSRTSVEGVGFWFDWGELNAPSVVPGPIGPQGIQGEAGVRGSFWYSQTGAPTITQGVNNNDQALDGSTGNTYQFVNGAWQLTGNIRGPQGIQGIQGIVGPTGPQGPQGIQGQKGDQGQFIEIIGTLENTNQLPMPDSVPRYSAYLIPDATGTEHVWLLVGEGTTASPILWHDAGGFGGGSTVTINGVQQSSIDLGNDITVPSYGLGANTMADIDGVGTHFLSLEASGKNPAGSAAAKQEADIVLPIVDSDNIKRVVDGDKVAFDLTQAFMDQLEQDIADATPPEVQINAPTTATNGQLTADQLATLQANKGAYLFFNNEIFRLQDTQHIAGYLIYSHLGYENTTQTYKIKCITITISTRGWVLTERVVVNGNNYVAKSGEQTMTGLLRNTTGIRSKNYDITNSMSSTFCSVSPTSDNYEAIYETFAHGIHLKGKGGTSVINKATYLQLPESGSTEINTKLPDYDGKLVANLSEENSAQGVRFVSQNIYGDETWFKLCNIPPSLASTTVAIEFTGVIGGWVSQQLIPCSFCVTSRESFVCNILGCTQSVQQERWGIRGFTTSDGSIDVYLVMKPYSTIAGMFAFTGLNSPINKFIATPQISGTTEAHYNYFSTPQFTLSGSTLTIQTN